MGFMHNLGWCSIKEAEPWTVCKGLELAWQAGHKKLVIGIDSEVVVKWLNKDEIPSSPIGNLISICMNLIARNLKFRINKVYIEQNRAADFLATEALKYDREFKIVIIPPACLQDIIEKDKTGIDRYRRLAL